MICPRCKSAFLLFPYGYPCCPGCLRVLYKPAPRPGLFLSLPKAARELYLMLQQVQAKHDGRFGIPLINLRHTISGRRLRVERIPWGNPTYRGVGTLTVNQRIVEWVNSL